MNTIRVGERIYTEAELLIAIRVGVTRVTPLKVTR